MNFDILTLFPDMFAPLRMSMLRRAEDKGLLSVRVVDIRDYTKDRNRRVDDYPFGGGQGMLLESQPVFDALRAVGAEQKKIVYMSPRGRIVDRETLSRLSREPDVVILCGHYEGVDQRILDAWDIEELSIGDYILTGGELPAMVLVDAVARLLPGVLASEEAARDESVYSGLLEYPQYTQPRSFEGLDVPDVLLSGDHRKIHLWKFEQSLRLTKERRPDLFEEFVKNHRTLAKDEQKIMEKVIGMM